MLLTSASSASTWARAAASSTAASQRQPDRVELGERLREVLSDRPVQLVLVGQRLERGAEAAGAGVESVRGLQVGADAGKRQLAAPVLRPSGLGLVERCPERRFQLQRDHALQGGVQALEQVAARLLGREIGIVAGSGREHHVAKPAGTLPIVENAGREPGQVARDRRRKRTGVVRIRPGAARRRQAGVVVEDLLERREPGQRDALALETARCDQTGVLVGQRPAQLARDGAGFVWKQLDPGGSRLRRDRPEYDRLHVLPGEHRLRERAPGGLQALRRRLRAEVGHRRLEGRGGGGKALVARHDHPIGQLAVQVLEHARGARGGNGHQHGQQEHQSARQHRAPHSEFRKASRASRSALLSAAKASRAA